MARIRSSLWTWLIVIVSAGPAVLLVPHDTRLFVVGAAILGWLLGFALLRLLSSGLLTDPSWRRPTQWGWSWLDRVRRREYVVPAELPPPPGLLIGRDAEVNRIIEHLNRPGANAPRVVWIYGPAGVGKSALAIGVAQLLTDRYWDGQLLARLDRASPDEGVEDALRMFVTALGGPSDKVPDGVEQLERRYRDLTANRRVLVIVDAVDEPADVLGLLPHGKGCAALITAREAWHEMPDWLVVEVRRLDQRAALRVLEALVGAKRVEAEPAPARRIVEAADGNPFALQLAGVALAARQNWTLRGALQRMSEVQLPNHHRHNLPSCTPAFNLSFALLTEQERRAFALLGLIETDTFSRWALGALLRGADHGSAHPRAVERGATSAADDDADTVAERILDRLVRGRLVERHIDDASGVASFTIPEPIRPYVRARMRADLDLSTRAAAGDELTQEHISRGERSPEQLLRNQVYHRLQAGELPAALSTAHDALALCGERLQRARSEEERDRAHSERSLVLAALAEVNAELGWLEEARQYAQDALLTPHPRSRPRALRCLGLIHRRLHRLDEADDCLSAAEIAATEIGDRSELIRILRDRALVGVAREDPDTATRLIEQAIELCQALGEAGWRRLPPVLWANGAVLMAREEWKLAEQTLVRADALCSDGASGAALWLPWIRHQRALLALADQQPGHGREFALRASERFRDMHHRYGIAHCRLVIGRSWLTEHDYQAAIPMLEEALQTFVGCGDRWAEADTRLPLAEALRHVGRLAEARKALVRAAQDFNDLGDVKRRNLARTRLSAIERELRTAPQGGRRPRAALPSAPNRLRDKDVAPLP